MTGHLVVIGYGQTGRDAVGSVLASRPETEVTVLDIDFLAVVEATANGATALHADGRSACALRAAATDTAVRVIVTVPDDLDALLIAQAVLSIDPGTVVVAVIREPANHALFARCGITSVHIGRNPEQA